MKALMIVFGLCCCAPMALAQEGGPARPRDAPEPPMLPPQVESGEALEPEVTIIQTDREIIQEYRINGRLYMVRITPQAGPPYYLLDIDGDGQLDVESDDISNIAIPQWVLFRW